MIKYFGFDGNIGKGRTFSFDVNVGAGIGNGIPIPYSAFPLNRSSDGKDSAILHLQMTISTNINNNELTQ